MLALLANGRRAGIFVGGNRFGRADASAAEPAGGSVIFPREIASSCAEPDGMSTLPGERDIGNIAHHPYEDVLLLYIDFTIYLE